VFGVARIEFFDSGTRSIYSCMKIVKELLKIHCGCLQFWLLVSLHEFYVGIVLFSLLLSVIGLLRGGANHFLIRGQV